MTLSALIWLLVGAVAGAVAARLFSVRQFGQHKLKNELAESKAQLDNYRAEVSSHLETTQKLMSQLQDNYEQIARHMASTRMTLVDKAEVQTPSQFNFLTKETTEQLRSSVTERETRRRRKVTHTEQPLDYASHSSGMLRSVSEQKNQDV